MIKKTLKFTLCALLLSAVGSAFAAGEEVTPEETSEVTLKNGSGISWEDFVANLNNPANIKGEADSTALYNARVAYLGVDYPAVKTGGARGDSISKAETYTSYKTRYENAEKQLSANNISLTQLTAQSTKKGRELTQWTDSLATLKALPKEVPTWLNTAYQGATKFANAYNEVIGADMSATIWYTYTKNSKGAVTLYVAFGETEPSNKPGTNDWNEVTQGDFFDAITTLAASTTSKKIASLSVYFGEEYGKIMDPENPSSQLYYPYLSFAYDTETIANQILAAVTNVYNDDKYKTTAKPTEIAEVNSKISQVRKDLEDIDESIDEVHAEIDAYTKLQTGQNQTVQDQYLSAYTTAQSNYNTAVTEANLKREAFRSAITAYATAQKEAAANALGNYDEVILNADITAATSFINAYSGRINANNHVITINIPNNAALFSNFRNGHLENAIINGVFATGGEYFNVAAWRGANGIYYDDNGNNGGTITNIGKLAYDNRDLMFFSADIANKKLVKWDENSQVYDITLYQPNATTQFYTNISGSTFVNNPIAASEISGNAFYESKTDDFGDIANVIVDKTCANVVIKDKESFYCPFDITATKVTLSRNLNAGFNTVCLPFEMTYTNMGLGANDLLCTYDKETTDKFWFSKTTEVAANTPALIYLETGNNGSTSLSGVTIKQTESQLVNFEGSTDDKSQACGLFKNTTAESIRGGSQAIKVYGLQGGSSVTNPDDPSGAKFNPAGNATFGAFRMVIVSELAAEQAEQGQPLRARGIGVVDEKGIEINFGDLSVVEIIDMESSSLTVTPGHGEIIITTDANYGMQTVYTMDGKAVAKVNVVEGTNTVNVPSGIYVVMGQKVMVD